MEVLKSNIDASVNFVENQLIGFTESRFVRRSNDYFICYLSSQTGCNLGCKFCHLTATKQFKSVDCDLNDYLTQADSVFQHYKEEAVPASTVHFNFMARGEFFSNKWVINNAPKLLSELYKLAKSYGLYPKFNISTIIPKTFIDLNRSLMQVFDLWTPTIYYSIYSCNNHFRRKWLPNAASVKDGLQLLKDYQKLTKKIIKIHYCFIEGKNDTLDDLDEVISALNSHELVCEFNLVRYNPFSKEQGEESSEEIVQYNLNYLKNNINGKVQEIPRVGFDVKASCGMFVEKSK